MPKRVVYTKITPLPSNVPRQLALDMLHSHGEIIGLNPLVTGHKPIPAPRDATRDEYFAQWYEIEEIITWGFGMKKKIAFKGCFHDMPWGLQTHIYAPMGVDLRNKYQIAGNQPGEPKEVRELGVEAPAEGLYLKEDVEITCNIALASFVKKETKQTLLTMIERMTRKAELLDDGVLHAMFENGKLKTINPNQEQLKDTLRAGSLVDISSPSVGSSPGSPPSIQQEFSPSHTFTKYSRLPGRIGTQRTSQISQSSYNSPEYGAQELDASPNLHASGFSQPHNNAVEMEGSTLFVPGDKEQYPFQHSDAPGITYAELADTSTAPNRLSSVSFEYDAHPNTNQADSYPKDQKLDPSEIARLSGAYKITNPEHPALRTSVAYPDGPDDYNSTTRSSQGDLAGQMGGLNISNAHRHSVANINRCPMDQCDFEGDSAAINHHVNRHHFS